MKVAIHKDEYGRFHAVDVTNRDGMWELITEVLSDSLANREAYLDDLDYKSLNEEEWMDFIRGEQVEIVELF